MLWRIAAFAALGGFLFGYDLGVMGGALLGISDEMATSEWMEGLIVGAAKLGACFGAFLGGALMLHYGRRIAISVDSVLFMLGPIFMASAAGVTGLIFGRLLVGLAIGVSAVVVPAYLGEVAPAAVRGTIVELYEVLLCIGMLTAALVDWGLSSVPGAWRWMLALPLLPALLMSAALFVLPESPRWLVVTGRLDEALAVIHHILTSTTLPDGSQASTAEVEQELMELWSAVEKDKALARERALEARQRNLAALRHKGLGWQLGQRKQRWHSLSTIEPQARAGPHVAAAAARHGHLPPLPAASSKHSQQSQYTSAMQHQTDASAAEAGECEMQPLVHGSSMSHEDSDRAMVEPQPARGRFSDGSTAQQLQYGDAAGSSQSDSYAAGSERQAPDQHAVASPQDMYSPSCLPLDRQETDIPFGKPSPDVVSPGTNQTGSDDENSSGRTQQVPDRNAEPAAGTVPSPTASAAAAAHSRRASRVISPEISPAVSPSSCSGFASLQPTPPLSLASLSDVQHTGSGGSQAGSQSAPPTSLLLQHSTSLTIRTAHSEDAQAQTDGGSPIVWYDEQGTPMFHKCFNDIPPGLTPIRTRSEDVEADYFADSSRVVPDTQVAAPAALGPDGSSSVVYGPQGFWGAFHDMLVEVGAAAQGPERSAFWMAIYLAIFNQACASTSIINYAPEILEHTGIQTHADSILYSSGVGASKVLGVVCAMLLVDSVGRRPLLLGGSAVTAAAMLLLCWADAIQSWLLVLAAMCAFIVAFSISWAGVFWVLMSELFSMTVKSPAVAAATAALFLAGAVTDVLFLGLHQWFGSLSFVIFAAISAAGGVYVFRNVPETRGKKLDEVQAVIRAWHPDKPSGMERRHPSLGSDLPDDMP